jgi:hypothetical protein
VKEPLQQNLLVLVSHVRSVSSHWRKRSSLTVSNLRERIFFSWITLAWRIVVARITPVWRIFASRIAG